MKPGALADRRIAQEIRHRVVAGRQQIAGGLTERVLRVRVDHQPAARGGQVEIALRFRSVLSGVSSITNALSDGFSGHGASARIDLADAVGPFVDVEIEPEVEEVLMVDGRDVGRDEVPETAVAGVAAIGR